MREMWMTDNGDEAKTNEVSKQSSLSYSTNIVPCYHGFKVIHSI